MTVPTFEQYVATLSAVDTAISGGDPLALSLCQLATDAIQAARPLTGNKLAKILEEDPHLAPVLAAAAGLSQERFRSWLTHHFDTGGWVKLAQTDARALAGAFDRELDLVNVLEAQAARQWTWADVLARTMAPRQRAASSVKQGRALEDAVERIISELDLTFTARTRFNGTGGQTGPVDFAIPSGGADTLIAVAVKGFDSTGSKLTDAATEIETMADVRQPRQYIFAVVDGVGWLRRKNDL
ncbi:MAG: hypothetical protein ACRDMJ_16650, partial [Solirubrobacteraceae bacterium]